jgi:hypothetical protein
MRLERLRYLVLLLPVLGLMVSVYAGWPGGISPDAGVTIREGLHVQFSGYQEPLWGLTWAIPLALFPLSTTVALFYLLQVLAYWLTFALFAYASLRERSLVLGLLAALVGFLPPLFDFVVMIESNMQTGIAWALAIALAYAFPGKRTLALCLLLCFYGYIARSGMIVAVAPAVLACVLLCRPGLPKRSAVLYSVGSAAGFALLSFTVTQLFLGAPTRAQVLSVSQLFDIAGVYRKTGTHCIPASLVPDTTTATAILAEYDPGLVSSIIWSNSKGGFRLPSSRSELADLKNCWLLTIRRHPAEFFQVKARFARMFLMIGTDWAPAILPDYAANVGLGLSVPDNAAWRTIRKYVERSGRWLVWKGWFWLLLAGLGCAAASAFRGERKHAALAVYAAALGSLIPHFVLGQAVLSRYFFLPGMLYVACLLLLGSHFLAAWRTRGASSIEQQP